jgi:hypothetical protein
VHICRCSVPAFTAAMLVSAQLCAQTRPVLPSMPGSIPGSIPRSMPGAMPGSGPQDYQKLLAQYDATQASAARPGDEQLSCDAMQEEVVASMNDPAFQAYIASAGASAQRDLAKMQTGQAAMAAGNVAAAAAALTPGGAAVQAAAQRARDAGQRVAAEQRIQEEAQGAEQLAAFMPQMMRSQRLLELAGAKGCEWLSEPGFDGAAMFGGFEQAAPTPQRSEQ